MPEKLTKQEQMNLLNEAYNSFVGKEGTLNKAEKNELHHIKDRLCPDVKEFKIEGNSMSFEVSRNNMMGWEMGKVKVENHPDYRQTTNYQVTNYFTNAQEISSSKITRTDNTKEKYSAELDPRVAQYAAHMDLKTVLNNNKSGMENSDHDKKILLQANEIFKDSGLKYDSEKDKTSFQNKGDYNVSGHDNSRNR
jgi:hypothetical protein